MNPAWLQTELDEVSTEINAAFVAHAGLTAESLRAIHEAMQQSDLTFGQAALQLGLLTEEDIKRAIAQSLSVPDADVRRGSIVETALAKNPQSRQIMVRPASVVALGEQLRPMLDPLSAHAEQIRTLRTQILLLTEATRGASMLAVVSPRVGDGRSRLAAELAISFAQLGKRTLLVDADLRRSGLQKLFDYEGNDGLAESILGDSPPLLHPVKDVAQLQFLPAGSAGSANPLELLSDNRLAKIIEKWRRDHTFVVIDTPPLADHADAVAVAKLVGRVVMLSRAKHTKFKDLKDMMRRLAVSQSHVLGAVINHF
jgi:protein-tyrosine kinase